MLNLQSLADTSSLMQVCSASVMASIAAITVASRCILLLEVIQALVVWTHRPGLY